jgi:hypothetical protein
VSDDQHVNRTRSALTDARWHLRLARDGGEVPRDVAAVLLAALADADDRLGRYERKSD